MGGMGGSEGGEDGSGSNAIMGSEIGRVHVNSEIPNKVYNCPKLRSVLVACRMSHSKREICFRIKRNIGLRLRSQNYETGKMFAYSAYSMTVISM